MKCVVLAVVFGMSVSAGAAAQPATQPRADAIAQAYDQFLLGHNLESSDKVDEAIAAFKRAMALDPTAAEIPAELASLYMRQNRASEAISTAEDALKIDPHNREAHRVLGLVWGAIAQMGRESSRTPVAGEPPNDSLKKAIDHLEQAIANPVGVPDATTRATLARLYVRGGMYDKAIPLLTDLVTQEPGWADGPVLLAEAYSGAGRNKDAIAWLEQASPGDPELLPTLADFYERERRWKDAAKAYAVAVQRLPKNMELRTRYASALLKTGTRQDATAARDVLTETLAIAPGNTTALYWLSEAQRRTGDLAGAESTARKLIAQNGRTPWGYYALAETLEERRQYQDVVDVLAPAVQQFRTARRSGDRFELTLLLPHLGFAYQQLQQHDKAIAAFEEAHAVAPSDLNLTAYLAEEYLAARKYPAALALLQGARKEHETDLRLARLEGRALHLSGKEDEAIATVKAALAAHPDDPDAYVALAQRYVEANRGNDAVALLEEAQSKLPGNDTLTFELGAVFDKQKRYGDAEAAFRQLIARDPENAAALNYLGYMLADRGQRLDESVAMLKKAVALEPENGSYLDSLGWAYFKADRLDLAEPNLKKAADQLTTNSVVQAHYAELLYKRGRVDEAIAAWNRALAGDGESLDRAEVEKKVRAAQQKLGKQ